MPITILLLQRDGAYDRQVSINYPGTAVVDDQPVTVAVNGEEILQASQLIFSTACTLIRGKAAREWPEIFENELVLAGARVIPRDGLRPVAQGLLTLSLLVYEHMLPWFARDNHWTEQLQPELIVGSTDTDDNQRWTYFFEGHPLANELYNAGHIGRAMVTFNGAHIHRHFLPFRARITAAQPTTTLNAALAGIEVGARTLIRQRFNIAVANP